MSSEDELSDRSDDVFSDEELSDAPSDDGDAPHANGQQRDGAAHPTPKRQKLDAPPSDPLYGAGAGIDHEQEAEASILQLEIRELLGEAAVPAANVDVLQDAVGRIAKHLGGLKEAKVDTAPLKGLLQDFQFVPAVRLTAF